MACCYKKLLQFARNEKWNEFLPFTQPPSLQLLLLLLSLLKLYHTINVCSFLHHRECIWLVFWFIRWFFIDSLDAINRIFCIESAMAPFNWTKAAIVINTNIVWRWNDFVMKEYKVVLCLMKLATVKATPHVNMLCPVAIYATDWLVGESWWLMLFSSLHWYSLSNSISCYDIVMWDEFD